MSIPTNQNCSRPDDSPSLEEIDILWITAGLGCDDTIAVTAATQPTLEEILFGALPGILDIHNRFLSYKNGDDFLQPFHLAAEGRHAHFTFVVEGSIPAT